MVLPTLSDSTFEFLLYRIVCLFPFYPQFNTRNARFISIYDGFIILPVLSTKTTTIQWEFFFRSFFVCVKLRIAHSHLENLMCIDELIFKPYTLQASEK